MKTTISKMLGEKLQKPIPEDEMEDFENNDLFNDVIGAVLNTEVEIDEGKIRNECRLFFVSDIIKQLALGKYGKIDDKLLGKLAKAIAQLIAEGGVFK